MNKKGFTLVELLGVVIILSIIMLIAIPNVMSILDRSKKDAYLADARKMVSLTEYEIRKGNVLKPAAGNLVKVTLGDLATSDVDKDADNHPYDTENSYVVIVRKNGYLVYYVQLVANVNGNYRGVRLTNSENLKTNVKYEKFSKDIILPDNSEINSKKNSND